jgi:glutathione synthase/RimK-type ligase-like ATP-grasp enzyme
VSVLSNVAGTEGILKPCVSGAARHTYRLPLKEIPRWQELVDQLLPLESLMVQPFQEQILTNGEITLIAFNGKVSHAVRKRAKPGDFRVQDDHGGTVEAYTPLRNEIEFAERAFAACHPTPCYGRVDLVADRQGWLCVMELELIEPELWLRFLGNADAFAEAIHHHLEVNVVR